MGFGVPELLRRLKPEPPRFLNPDQVEPVPSFDRQPELLTRAPVAAPALTPPIFDTSEPVLERTPVAVDPAGMGAAPTLITRNDRGRPLSAVGEDPLTRDQDLLRAQQDYKAPFSKKDFALQTLFGFLRGGLPGAGLSAIDYGANQDTRNQMAVGSDMARTQGRINDELLTRNQNNDLLNDQSTRQYRNAQTVELLSRASRPERPANVQTGKAIQPDGTAIQMERNPTTGQWEVSLQDGQPIVVAPPPKTSPKVKVNVPGVGELEVSPDSALGYYGAQGNRADTLTRDNEKAGQQNASIEQNIASAREEQSKVEQALRDTAPTITKPGITYSDGSSDPPTVTRNPVYADLESRRDKLIDDQRRWGAEKKPVVSTPRGAGFKPARDGKFHYTPEQIRQSLKPGQTYEDVLRQLKARPNVMIDEN